MDNALKTVAEFLREQAHEDHIIFLIESIHMGCAAPCIEKYIDQILKEAHPDSEMDRVHAFPEALQGFEKILLQEGTNRWLKLRIATRELEKKPECYNKKN